MPMCNPCLLLQACIKVVRFINIQVGKMQDSMDGKNIEAVLMELGIRIHRVIYEHLLMFQYSSVGKSTCDSVSNQKSTT